MMRTGFGQRIREMREKASLSTLCLGNLLGLSDAYIDGLESNYIEPSATTLKRIAEIFNVSMEYALFLTDDLKVNENPMIRETLVVDRIRDAQGMPNSADVVGVIYLDSQMWSQGYCYAYVMPNDSMSKARIIKGDLLVIRKQQCAQNNDVVIACVDGGEAFVSRYTKRGNIVMLSPQSSSPEYKSMKIDITESKLSILGVVIEARLKKI